MFIIYKRSGCDLKYTVKLCTNNNYIYWILIIIIYIYIYIYIYYIYIYIIYIYIHIYYIYIYILYIYIFSMYILYNGRVCLCQSPNWKSNRKVANWVRHDELNISPERISPAVNRIVTGCSLINRSVCDDLSKHPPALAQLERACKLQASL